MEAIVTSKKDAGKKKAIHRHRKSRDNHRHDRILRFFLRLEIGQFSPLFGAISLPNYTENLEKEGQSTGEKKSSGDGALKLQISLPGCGRTCPDIPALWSAYPFAVFPQGNVVHHSLLLLSDLGVRLHTERGGVPRWWCILFSFPGRWGD